MDIKEIRTQNLKMAINIAGGMTQLAEKAGTSTSYLSQCLSTKVDKSLGSKVARRIEETLGLEHGWMDTSHGESDIADDDNLPILLKQLSDTEKDDLHEFIYLMLRRRKITEKYL